MTRGVKSLFHSWDSLALMGSRGRPGRAGIPSCRKGFEVEGHASPRENYAV